MNFFIRMILIILLPCSLLKNIFAAGGDDCPQKPYDNGHSCDNKYTKSHCTALIKSSNSTSSQSDQFDQIIQKVQETQIQNGSIFTGYINRAFDYTVSLPKEGYAVCPLQNESWMRTKSGEFLFDVIIEYTSIDDVLRLLQLPSGFPKSESEIEQKIPGNGKYIDKESSLGISVDIFKNICIGHFKNGEIQGFGLGFCKKVKYLFIGNFLDGEAHGWGRSHFTNGDIYKGDYVRDFRSGWGEYYFKNGEKYEGNFIRGLRSGWGTYYFENGNEYEGNFVKDLRHGKGTMNYKDGKTKTVFYFNNKQVSEGKFNDLTTKSS